MAALFELILDGRGNISAQPIEMPTPAADEVLVRVGVVGICASDMALFDSAYTAPHKMPICFGHEWSGTAEAVGSSVTKISSGDHVTGECSLWCGECDRCKRNRNLCRSIQKFGITVDGAARSYVVMKERYLHKGVPSLDMHALALSEPLAVSAEGIMAAAQAHAAPLQEQRVLVMGCGIIGMGCLVVLKHYYNCKDVTVHDIEPARVNRAVTFGALRLSADIEEPASSKDYTSLYGRDGFDVIIETTGTRSAFEQALPLLNPGGTLAMTGYLGKTEFTPKDLVLKAARMVGRIGGTEMFDEIVPWLAEHGEMARKVLVTHTFSAGQAAEAFAIARDRENVLKVQITF